MPAGLSEARMRVISTPPSFAASLDALSGWRRGLVARLASLIDFVGDHDLVDESLAAELATLRVRLGSDKLLVAFVAEFSRGKSELINAIFFSDAGRRVLPASPGRTTMCPVELAWDESNGPMLSLLAIESRLEGVPLGELREQPRAWRHMPLDVADPEQLAHSLMEVTRTEWMSRERARELGFWDDERPHDNPPVDDTGRVQVPAWRHALINYPHPLLRQGLVVLDTPGLNAIGAEPELTLGLLPSAHATVFVLAADSGVTKSDMAIWRDHLDTQALSRFVVLNKIDTLRDGLLTPQQISEQITNQQRDTARTLGIATDRVFPLSARQALTARVAGDDAALGESRVERLEDALGEQLLPQRRELLEQMVLDAAQRVETHLARRLGDGRRQLAEQLLELRGLRGKSGSRLELMLQRVDAEREEFEQCSSRLQAMRLVHSRFVKEQLIDLSTDRLHEEVARMEAGMNASFLNLGAKKAFIALCQRLQAQLGKAQMRAAETREMLGVSFGRMNAEFGFSLVLNKGPELESFERELAMIERNYVQYLGPTQALRLSGPKFMAEFRRMLVSRLRVVFENASSEVELWNKTASAQLEAQLRDRLRGFRHRREALERVQTAAGDLETRISELEQQDRYSQTLLANANELIGALREQASISSIDIIDTVPSVDIALDTQDELAARRRKLAQA
jgi:hypothetical protein